MYKYLTYLLNYRIQYNLNGALMAIQILSNILVYAIV